MVNPVDMAASNLGITPPSKNEDPEKAELGRLFTLMLVSAGRKGCACDSCGFGEELAELMAKRAPSPFPAAPAPPAPAGPGGAIPTAAAPTPPPQAPPPPQTPPAAATVELPDA